jgi:hypothetical protein
MANERRSYPRFPVQCPVEVSLPDSKAAAVFPATSSNLSRTSIQIECSAELVAALLRQQKLPYTCRLLFTLPWHKHKFQLDAHVVTHRRLSQFHYVLVLVLRHNDPVQEDLLETQLARQHPLVGLD